MKSRFGDNFRSIILITMLVFILGTTIIAGCSSGGGGGGSTDSPTYTPTSSPTSSPTVTPTVSPTVTPTSSPTPTVTPVDTEFYLNNPTSGAKIWAKVFYPPNISTRQKYHGLVMIPGGLGYGSQFADAPNGPVDFAEDGFIVMVFDPDGRGNSGGDENWNGIIHQDALNTLLKEMAANPYVDADNIGVYTNSLGIAIGAGALGRYPNDPPVKYLVDGEGPSDRFYITKFDDPEFLKMFDGHTTDDVEWWKEREACRTIQTYPGKYLRLQTILDHVHKEDKGHALMMMENATAKSYGGNGVCSWTRINTRENTENTVWTIENPPRWLPANSLQQLAPNFVKEMRDSK